ncbi:MAG: 2-amino-4-hydroxy-6-hydroxymethyldihydropteridine diphosphokinase [Bacteroidales bacterium]|jgi:2-amino-4-hydroxy-6-hydroxymethyldihydropteridine diphosphokinase|nr:2-amino-4-hydroxy-6-hydroxymethyldihydropteridine diphosphokinase [Bacteroidales bacterium]
MPSVFLILGANVGKCCETLEKSKDFIQKRIGPIVDQSPIYRSEPWGFDCADWFYNQAVRCKTVFSPETVLTEILDIEKDLGRIRESDTSTATTYMSRTIDIDILYYDHQIIQTENLQIPHKHLHSRRFVLLPLNDIAPDFSHPVLNKTTAELLRDCADNSRVERLDEGDARVSLTLHPPKYPYIAIEGVIGVGKTTLATMLSETLNAKLVLEHFAENPFLPKFYENPEQYAFPVELSFMAERFQQLQEHLIAPDLFHDTVVSDYITEKSLIFAGKTLSEDVFSLYAKLFHIIFATLPKPDLLVYLYASPEKLKANIVKRGRDYEQNIELDYLAQLQDGYLEHFKNTQNQRVLIIDVNDLDFVKNPEDYQKILSLLAEDYPANEISIRGLRIV